MSNDLSELPQGWKITTMSDVVLIEMGQSPDGSATNTTGDGLPLIGGASDLGENLPHPTRYTSTPTKVSEIGDLILCVRATIGKLNYADDHYCLGRGVAGLRPISFERDWLRYYLNYRAKDLDQAGTGTTFRQIDKATLQNWSIPFAPLNEQRRIVAKIEALKARSQRVKEALEAIPSLLDQFRQSVLAAAFRGDLTADWREKNPDVEPASGLLQKILKAHELVGGHKRGNAAPPTDGVHNLTSNLLPQAWEVAELRDLCEPTRPITYGILKPGPDMQEGVLYIRVADFPNDKLNIEAIRKTSYKIDSQYARSRLKVGDILLSIRGTVGRVCKIPSSLDKANITQDSARLSIQTDIDTDYICWIIRAKQTQQRMQKAIKGVAVRGINIGDVRALQIPLPPYLEQREIVHRVEALLKAADRIEQQYQQAKAYLDQLDQSILTKAFQGELVSQDLNDEPASVLLERIRAEREKRETEAKGAKKSTGKTTKRRSRKAEHQDSELIQLRLPGVE